MRDQSGERAPTRQDRGGPLPGSAAYFEQVAKDYSCWYTEPTLGGYALRIRQQRVLEWLGQAGGMVLDVGCGPGVMVRELLALGWEFWGVDAAPSMIQQCHSTFAQRQHAHFAVGDATCLDFPTGCFDAVLCTGVIDRIEHYALAIKEMLRVLKPHGTLVISFPNLYSPYAAWRKFVFLPAIDVLRPVYYRLTRRPQRPMMVAFSKLYTAAATRRLITQHGGEVTDVVYFNFNLFLSPLDELKLFSRWATWITARLEQLRFGKLAWLGSGFLLKATKGS